MGKVFRCINVTEDCSNILHLIELILTVPFMNIKVERLCSRMNRVKTDLRNRLNCSYLDLYLRIEEKGVAVDAFHIDPVTKLWFSGQAHHLKSVPNKLSRCVKTGAISDINYIDLDEFTNSDLEYNSVDELPGF